MQTRIQKWGNSLAVRIPKAFVSEINISYGTSVDLTVDKGRIIIDPNVRHEYRLEDLLGDINRQNLHAEIETDDAVGRENL
ncbi:AbrB/MazE/SpoVT family DNA-binding domain-containing protein [Candidatus Fermentibacteria bacterium]|jgi:antitoxin MazE|nr:MAG: AbrB/MazE/SpoVT family DNA-binding domain-containing protein [Candidatus Fermentibacteria bacterium]